MTTILFTFFLAFALSLILTPAARRAGSLLGAMDQPGERKLHTTPVPRIGGVGIVTAFLLTLAVVSFVPSDTAALLAPSPELLAFGLGAGVCVLVGFADDLHGLRPATKLLFQLLAASVAYAGGMQIRSIGLGDEILELGLFSYPLTLLWFLVFINAVNLADGLDGLAGGITFFAALVMVLLSMLGQRYLSALLFAALCGSVLGFLRYNFNPASVFLGDSGSYFLGYCMAALAVLGGSKSQVGTAILIPVVALGLPLFDTVLSTLRRFMVGQRIFGADREHIHHRLLSLGLDTRHAVLLLYGITIALGLVSLVVVNLRDERAGLLLVLLGVASLVFARKLGYFDYLQTGRVIGWLRDVSDESGLSWERRSFFNTQLGVSRASDLDGLWRAVTQALELVSVDYGLLYLDLPGDGRDGPRDDEWRTTPIESASVSLRTRPADYIWVRPGLPPSVASPAHRLFRIELPLENPDRSARQGTLVLIKDHRQGPINQFTLKRIEHLRRDVEEALGQMGADGGTRDRRV
jgi:UDP-GlcNAc:undecaprenyl-phosphate GlcNAc-1-phosphate transferase